MVYRVQERQHYHPIPLKKLIGDDEHGWSPSGIFNVEGGCYAKVVGLDEKKEPVIYKATHAPGSIIENVALDSKGNIDFNDTTITENTRSCYSLNEIVNVFAEEYAPHPSTIIMLTCDAFGVLPPVSKLTIEQTVFSFCIRLHNQNSWHGIWY